MGSSLRMRHIVPGARGRRLSRNSAAAAARIISTSGFGPTWRVTDGNTDDSPKDRLDLYDGKEPRRGLGLLWWGGCVSLDTVLASGLAKAKLSSGNNSTVRLSRKLYRRAVGSAENLLPGSGGW